MADSETPPAPPQGMGNALTSGAAPVPGGNALASGMPPAPPGPQGAPQAAPPQLTHAQTVAALRHFDTIKRELGIIAQDPALGKTSIKSKVIDSVTRLVAERFMKPTEAVAELSKVPAEPLLQMKWVKGMLAQAQQAENGILDHYGATSPHMGTVADHFAATRDAYKADDHMDHLAAMSANFKDAA